nr:MAG TPA: hypothetical protein [Caudoviricetes sp.]DAW68636.1 MAG TPA: hypothetical protein [Caudoviricetes sp.]
MCSERNSIAFCSWAATGIYILEGTTIQPPLLYVSIQKL